MHDMLSRSIEMLKEITYRAKRCSASQERNKYSHERERKKAMCNTDKNMVRMYTYHVRTPDADVSRHVLCWVYIQMYIE